MTQGGPGEEDEQIVYEVRAKALKYISPKESGSDSGSESTPGDKNKSPWSTQGVGPLRVLKHKTTGAVRLLLRSEPRGHVALNRALLPQAEHKADGKYIKLTTAGDGAAGGLETWMLQVKTPASAKELAGILEAQKMANKK